MVSQAGGCYFALILILNSYIVPKSNQGIRELGNQELTSGFVSNQGIRETAVFLVKIDFWSIISKFYAHPDHFQWFS